MASKSARHSMSANTESVRNDSTPKASTQGPFTLWLGLKLSTMVRVARMGAEIHPCRWSRLALLPGMAVYNSVMSGIESLRFRKQIAATTIDQGVAYIPLGGIIDP